MNELVLNEYYELAMLKSEIKLKKLGKLFRIAFVCQKIIIRNISSRRKILMASDFIIITILQLFPTSKFFFLSRRSNVWAIPITLRTLFTVVDRVCWRIGLAFCCQGSSFWNVRVVVEVEEEEHHGPRVVECDRVEEPRVITVRSHELVVTGVTDDQHKLDLKLCWAWKYN